MLGQKISLIIFIIVSGLFLSVTPVSAAGVSVMPYPISQQLLVKDSNGDIGTYNCMAASLASALTTLSFEKTASLDTPSITYSYIRQLLREQISPERGIPPAYLIGAAEVVSEGKVRLMMKQKSANSLATIITEELTAGKPVIVHVSDRQMLYQDKEPGDASHVVVVYGIDEENIYFMDPWDGGMHKETQGKFMKAFSTGTYPGWLFTFSITEPEPTFASIIQKL